MNSIYRQAAIGACVAAALMLGANAAPVGAAGQVPSYRTLAIGAQATLGERVASAVVRAWGQGLQRALPYHGAYLAETFETCRDKVLDDAFDAFGELAAQLKQL